MGNLLTAWLQRNNNADVSAPFVKYFEHVRTQLQDSTGCVLNKLGNRGERLYNWPWVMRLHIATAALNINLPGSITATKLLDRLMLILENSCAEGGDKLYAIGLSMYKGLRALQRFGNNTAYTRALSLYEQHGESILDGGLDYPAFQVNFEQFIVVPASITSLELYWVTNDSKWLGGVEPQLETLLRFSGKQPNYRLHDVAIRHWDRYWFDKDRMWGDVFPHH